MAHRSSRLLARQPGDVSHVTVTRLWKSWQLQPWRAETFKFSADPQLVAKGTDIPAPAGKRDRAVRDEKSQIQVLEHTQPILLLKPGQAEKQSHDYRRHGTTTLFAALEVATGKITDACYPRHHDVGFLKLVARTTRTGSCTSSWTATRPTTTRM